MRDRIFVIVCLRRLFDAVGQMPVGVDISAALRTPSFAPASRFARFPASSFLNVLPTPLSLIDCYLRDGVA
jgi:hypothetical protein